MQQKVITALTHPWAAAAFVVSALGQLGFAWFDPVWGLIVATSSYWFPAIATAGATLLPELGYAEIGTQLLLGAGVLFVGVQLYKLVKNARQYLNNR